MVEKGDVGAKTGRGFFNYGPGDISEIIKARDVKLLALLRLLYPKRPKGDQR
jgi:3-hydroxyacyl-CoA dehydrogenase